MNLKPAFTRIAALSALVVFAGCGDSPSTEGGHHAAGGGHKHESAHGGVAVELGEHQYHLDVLSDPATGTLKLWVMDGHAENFVRVTNRVIDLVVMDGTTNRLVLLKPQANVASGETEGDTSFFQAEKPWLQGLTNFTGFLPRLEVRGSTFNDIRFSYPDKH